MSLATSSEERDGVAVIAVTGEIDLANADDLERRLEGALVGVPGLVVDLLGVEYLDSSALACLHRVSLAAGDRGIGLRVVTGDRGMAQRLLTITGLDRVLRASPSVDAAVGELRRPD